MKTLKTIITAAIICTFAHLPIRTSANNLTLGGTITIVSGNQISFTIKWDNSWYVATAPNNWDAVWLFVKYKDCATTNWLHAPLSTTGTDHTVSGGSGLLSIEMPAVNDGTGVFIRRTATGTGNITNAETVTLTLNGIATGSYNFKVFGIEMVKVLNENFVVGDGTSTNYFNGTATTITSEGALTAAQLGGGASAVPAAYPKGWNAFYCMKYEITQEQYVDFLNTLTYDQQVSRAAASPAAMPGVFAMSNTAGINWRNGIVIKTSGVASTTPAVYAMNFDGDGTFDEATQDGLTIACSYLNWGDLIAYCDWAGLRPMTDLEFEKVCRGSVTPAVGGEYAWGNGNLTAVAACCGGAGFINGGNTTEIYNGTGNGLCATDNSGLVWNDNRNGSVRVGFASTATTNRVQAGASYYGAMDMSGNVWERVVAVNAAGVTYTGTLGNGALKADGNTDLSTMDGGTWPSYSTASGGGFRGGAWYSNSLRARTSDRNDATSTVATRNREYGGRGVR